MDADHLSVYYWSLQVLSSFPFVPSLGRIPCWGMEYLKNRVSSHYLIFFIWFNSVFCPLRFRHFNRTAINNLNTYRANSLWNTIPFIVFDVEMNSKFKLFVNFFVLPTFDYLRCLRASYEKLFANLRTLTVLEKSCEMSYLHLSLIMRLAIQGTRQSGTFYIADSCFWRI